jgi:hypothetical protein
MEAPIVEAALMDNLLIVPLHAICVMLTVGVVQESQRNVHLAD